MAQVSQYEPIWITLKSERKCRITAPVALHKRIIKAVTKRKNLDIAYKVEREESGFKDELNYVCNQSTVMFTLTETKVYSFMNL